MPLLVVRLVSGSAHWSVLLGSSLMSNTVREKIGSLQDCITQVSSL